jgi:serine/threonine-protein kinase RsbW
LIFLRVPGTLQYRNVALRVVSAACSLAARDRKPSPDQPFDDELISAFGEAFNNIAIHGYEGVPVREIEVEIEAAEDAIIIRMTDWGRSFDFDDAPVPELVEPAEGGFGVYIIKAFTDEVSYRPGCPNVMTLTKRIPDRWLSE